MKPIKESDRGPRQQAGRNPSLSGRSPLPPEGGRKGGRPPSAGRAGALAAPRGRRSPRGGAAGAQRQSPNDSRPRRARVEQPHPVDPPGAVERDHLVLEQVQRSSPRRSPAPAAAPGRRAPGRSAKRTSPWAPDHRVALADHLAEPVGGAEEVADRRRGEAEGGGGSRRRGTPRSGRTSSLLPRSASALSCAGAAAPDATARIAPSRNARMRRPPPLPVRMRVARRPARVNGIAERRRRARRPPITCARPPLGSARLRL